MCVSVCVCMCVRVCVWVYLRMCACVRAEGEKEKTSRQTFHVLVAARYAPNVFHVNIMTIIICHIWKGLALVDQLFGKIVPMSLARIP